MSDTDAKAPDGSTEATAGATPKRGRRPLHQMRPHWFIEGAVFAVYMLFYWLALLLGRRYAGPTIAWICQRLLPFSNYSKRANANFDLVRPHYDAPRRRQIVKGVIANFANTFYEYAFLKQLLAESPSWRVEGLEHLEAARRANGGRFIIASAHIGNWEAIRTVSAREGAPLAIIYRAFNNKYVDDHVRGKMTALGWPAFRKGAVGGRELFKHIRAGNGAMILVDQRNGGAPIIDFMGQPAETSVAAAQLARSFKAPLLTAHAVRDGRSFVVRFDPPVPDGSPDEMMAEANRRIASWIDETPEQWLWMHRRWRIRRSKASRKFGRAHDADPASAEGSA